MVYLAVFLTINCLFGPFFKFNGRGSFNLKEDSKDVDFNSYFGVEGEEYFNPLLNRDTVNYLNPDKFDQITNVLFDGEAAWNTIRNFLSLVYNFYDEDKAALAADLLSVPKEVKATRLGLASRNNQGTGTSRVMLDSVMKLVHSLDVSQAGLSYRPQILRLFAHGFGPDHFSDLITNLAIKQLCDFTNIICHKYGIVKLCKFPMQYFDTDKGVWDEFMADLPYDGNGNPIILCPKSSLVHEYNFSTTQYVQLVIFAARQDALMAEDSPKLHHKFIKSRNQMVASPPTKKELYNAEVKPLGANGLKKYALQESIKHPELLNDYLNTTRTTAQNTENHN